jgi:parallel beta helix pectate lyase-like protein
VFGLKAGEVDAVRSVPTATVAAGTSLALALAGIVLVAGHAAAAGCVTTDFMQDGFALTAAVVDPVGPLGGTVDATGCNIGVYFDASSGSVDGATVENSNYYGVLVSDGASANVTNSTIAHIHDQPALDGSQHGVGIAYRVNPATQLGGSGTASDDTVLDYQKDGILANGGGASATITGNTVTGIGPTSVIAQNGIQVSRSATASVTGNSVSGNIYTQNPACAPAGVGSCVGVVATGILFFQAGDSTSVGDLASSNHAFQNQSNVTVIS